MGNLMTFKGHLNILVENDIDSYFSYLYEV